MKPHELELARQRSIYIARQLKERTSTNVRQLIEEFDLPLDFSDLTNLMISESAWNQTVKSNIQPHVVFAHPDFLKIHPNCSIHYRGIACLSLKRVQSLATQVESWENGTAKSIKPESFLKVARLYNAIISSIIVDASDWTLENGYQNIIATISISLDGSARNLAGQEAELEVRRTILEWLFDQNLIVDYNTSQTTFDLKNDCIMHFGSDPDISFIQGNEIVCTIEIKGGIDPAGAMERLGALQKSLRNSPVNSSNFVIAGVITKEMEKSLAKLANLTKYYLLRDITSDRNTQLDFFNEVFHHALRLTKEVKPKSHC